MADGTTAVLAVELSADPVKLLDGLKRASVATGAYADFAARSLEKVQLSVNGVSYTAAVSKAKAAGLEMIQLQHQLDVARAAGDRQTSAALQEQITLLQKVRQLKSAGLSGGDAMSAAKQALEAVAAARELAEAREAAAKRTESIRGNPGAALESVFSRSRLGVLEEGGAKIPVFGSALEELGAAGLAAAVGLAAAGAAAEQVRKAMEFAEDVERTSKALGVSTTSLQAFDSAAIATSIGQDKARDSLRSFNEVFGKYSSGLASAKQGKFFDALGFTPESARELGDTTEALEKTLQAIAKVQNPQQRATFAEQFGVSAFLPILADGTEGVEKFIAKMNEARNSDGIISPDQIQRAAELNDQVNELTHHIDEEFKKAFVDLAPEILQVAQFLDRCATAIAHLIGKLPDAAVGLEDLASKAKQALDLGYKAYLISQGRFGEAAQVGQGGSVAGPLTSEQRSAVADVSLPAGSPQFYYHQLHKAFDGLTNEGKTAKLRGVGGVDYFDGGLHPGVPNDPRDFGPAPTRGGDYTPPAKEKKPKRGPADETAGFDEKARSDADQAASDLAQAQASLITGIEAHAAAEKGAVDTARDKKLDDLADQELKLRASKNDQHKKQQQALIDSARSDIQNAAAAKKELIDRQAEIAADQRDRAKAAASADLDRRRSAAAEPGLTSNRSRADLSIDQFRAQQLAELKAVEGADADRVKQGSDDFTQADADAHRAEVLSTQHAELIAERQRQQRSASPLYAEAHPTTSVQDDLEGVEARGLSSLTDQLTGVVDGTKTVKAAFHDMASSIIADLIKIAVQREIEAPLANLLFPTTSSADLGNLTAIGGSVAIGGGDPVADAFKAVGGFLSLPGHATGADSFGGATTLDEEGTEGVAFLPQNTQIIPNDTLRGLARLDPASLGRSAGAVTLNVSVDAGGAFSFDHVSAAVEGGVNRAVAASGLQLAGVTKRQAVQQRQDASRF